MKPLKLGLIMASLFFSATAFAQTTTNSIFIEQVGDSSTITIEQSGSTNTAGDKTTDTPFVLNGSSQTVSL